MVQFRENLWITFISNNKFYCSAKYSLLSLLCLFISKSDALISIFFNYCYFLMAMVILTFVFSSGTLAIRRVWKCFIHVSMLSSKNSGRSLEIKKKTVQILKISQLDKYSNWQMRDITQTSWPFYKIPFESSLSMDKTPWAEAPNALTTAW